MACWGTHPPCRHPRQTPPVQCMLGYGQQTGVTHLTGMHSSLWSLCKSLYVGKYSSCDWPAVSWWRPQYLIFLKYFFPHHMCIPTNSTLNINVTFFSVHVLKAKNAQITGKFVLLVAWESIGPLWRRRISTIVALFDPMTSKSPP